MVEIANGDLRDPNPGRGINRGSGDPPDRTLRAPDRLGARLHGRRCSGLPTTRTDTARARQVGAALRHPAHPGPRARRRRLVQLSDLLDHRKHRRHRRRDLCAGATPQVTSASRRRRTDLQRAGAGALHRPPASWRPTTSQSDLAGRRLACRRRASFSTPGDHSASRSSVAPRLESRGRLHHPAPGSDPSHTAGRPSTTHSGAVPSPTGQPWVRDESDAAAATAGRRGG
jgi:hypothetical protein